MAEEGRLICLNPEGPVCLGFLLGGIYANNHPIAVGSEMSVWTDADTLFPA